MVKNKLGVGLYSLAGVYGEKDVDEIKRMLIYAVENGIKYFDVADQYGPAEEVLGETLHHCRSQIFITTKVGLTDDSGRDCSPQHIYEACQKSLERLKTDYIDLYQIHFDDPNTPVEDTVTALEKLQNQGLIKSYGVGHLSQAKLTRYLEKGNPATVMLEFSPIATEQYTKLYSLFNKKDVGIIAMGTAGRGLLTGKYSKKTQFPPDDLRSIDPLFHYSKRESALRILAKLQEIGHKYRKTPIQVALNWVMEQKRIAIVLTGPSTVDHLKENIASYGWKLETEDLKELNQIIKDEAHQRFLGVVKDVRQIMAEKIPYQIAARQNLDKTQVAADLVYVITHLIEDQEVPEEELMREIMQLLRWRHQKSNDWSLIRELKTKLEPYLTKKY